MTIGSDFGEDVGENVRFARRVVLVMFGAAAILIAVLAWSSPPTAKTPPTTPAVRPPAAFDFVGVLPDGGEVPAAVRLLSPTSSGDPGWEISVPPGAIAIRTRSR